MYRNCKYGLSCITCLYTYMYIEHKHGLHMPSRSSRLGTVRSIKRSFLPSGWNSIPLIISSEDPNFLSTSTSNALVSSSWFCHDNRLPVSYFRCMRHSTAPNQSSAWHFHHTMSLSPFVPASEYINLWLYVSSSRMKQGFSDLKSDICVIS